MIIMVSYWNLCVFILFSSFKDGATLRCEPGEFPSYVVAGNLVLDTSGVVGAAPAEDRSNVDLPITCQQICDGLTAFTCVSFSFSPVTNICKMYPVRSSASGVVRESKPDTFHYDGICSQTPNLDNCTATSNKVDLVFLVDASGSICDNDPSKDDKDPERCDNWRSLKTFMKIIINFLTISPDDTRVSLVTFADKADVAFNLQEYGTKNQIDTAINNLGYIGGNTNTYGGLNKLNTDIFVEVNGDRADGKNLVLVITDGFPTIDVNKTEPEAKTLQDNDVIMYAVGVTDQIDEFWLRILSSPPRKLGQNYFTSPDFDSLQPVIASLLSAACIQLDPVFGTTTTQATTTTTTGTEATTLTTTTPGIMDIDEFYEWLQNNPEYAAMAGMGIVILLLFITIIVILCRYTGKKNEEKYREKA